MAGFSVVMETPIILVQLLIITLGFTDKSMKQKTTLCIPVKVFSMHADSPLSNSAFFLTLVLYPTEDTHILTVV